MRKLTLNLLLMGATFLVSPSAFAYSLSGPEILGDAWQVTALGFNPFVNPSPLGVIYGASFTDGNHTGPKNVGEGYRRNTPIMYYTVDQSFLGYFGSNGSNAIIDAFNVFNNLTNVDSYSYDLTEFPLVSSTANYTAQALNLMDLKSLTLSRMMRYLGVDDAVRYTWILRSRYPIGPGQCDVAHNITERNFDIHVTPLTQLLYTPYVNNALYTYTIWESCIYPPAPNPAPLYTAMAIPLVADPLSDKPPVASAWGFGSHLPGDFYVGLTRDDVAALRSLYRASNVNTENPAPGALLQPSGGTTVQLSTSDLGLLVSEATSTDPTTLIAEFPGLVITSVTTNYVWLNLQTNIVNYLTNFPGSAYGSPPTAVATAQVTPLVPAQLIPQYSYTFGNVITNSYNPISSAYLMTVSNLTVLKSAYNPTSTNVLGTNIVALKTTNFPAGDYYIIPPGVCGYSILQSGATNVFYTTNLVLTVTNGPYFISQSIVYAFTNHSYLAQQISCTGTTAPAGRYEGIDQMQFVYVDPGNYDIFTGRFIVPITNDYTMSLVVHTNGADTVTIQRFRRVLTSPDFVFSAQDIDTDDGGDPTLLATDPHWDTSNVLPGLAGPGTINTTGGTNTQITFNKVGPIYVNTWPQDNGPSQASTPIIFGSFDGTTNPPVVYPNGTSISDIQNQVFIQVLPADLPSATHGVAYSTTLSVNGGTAPYSWSLAAGSALPAGFTLSAGGTISGTTAQYGLFDFVVKMTDSASHVVQKDFTLTIK